MCKPQDRPIILLAVPYHSSDTCRQRRYADVTPVSGGFLSSVVSVERAIGLSSSCPWRLQAKVGQGYLFITTLAVCYKFFLDSKVTKTEHCRLARSSSFD